jgi:hypothetical protein
VSKRNASIEDFLGRTHDDYRDFLKLFMESPLMKGFFRYSRQFEHSDFKDKVSEFNKQLRDADLGSQSFPSPELYEYRNVSQSSAPMSLKELEKLYLYSGRL